MTAPTNILEQVETYCDAKLGALVNQNCFIANTNKEFKEFNEIKNLGATINIKLPDRSIASNGLVIAIDGVEQRLQPLICDQAANASHSFTEQDFKFGYEQYMDDFGLSRVMELGAKIEANLALNANSSVPVYRIVDGQSIPTGELHTESGPYRFFGDGETPINSTQQLVKMEAFFRNYGAAVGPLEVFFDDIASVDVVASALNQFVPMRNEEFAASWDLGTFKGSNAHYFKSNFLPIHTSGSCGDSKDTLTLVSTNDETGQNITQLTFSGASGSGTVIKSGDLLQFNPSTGLFYRTFVGHTPSQNRVQMRVINDADKEMSGNVTVNIYPALVSVPGKNQNLNKPLQVGMTAQVMPSHRCGLVVGGKAFFMAMPKLSNYRPYDSYTSVDKETKASLRNYYGNLFGKNQEAMVTDCMWASTVIRENSMRILFPLA